MSEALTEALRLAHERLDDDSDAYADQDLLGMLVEAVEGEPAPSIAAALLEGAQSTSAKARAYANGSAGEQVLVWAQASRTLLEAYRLAPIDAPGEGDDEERTALARMVTGYREEIAAHRRELVELAQRFDSANTPTASRVAGGIERHLNAYGVSALTEPAASE